MPLVYVSRILTHTVTPALRPPPSPSLNPSFSMSSNPVNEANCSSSSYNCGDSYVSPLDTLKTCARTYLAVVRANLRNASTERLRVY